MKYCFTTLAVGDIYEDSAYTLYRDLKERTSFCDFYITTANKDIKDLGDRVYFNYINPPTIQCCGGGHLSFNFNLKALALKVTLEKYSNTHYDYIIFSDADWGMHEDFQEEKILRMLDYMEKNETDFLFERPADVGGGRTNPTESFFRDKLQDYGILEYPNWDKAHVANEQFLVFKNSWKFKFFVQRWEQFLWYTVMNDIRNYAEGFEIGISALESNMKQEYSGVFPYFINNCFYFYTNVGVKHIRF